MKINVSFQEFQMIHFLLLVIQSLLIFNIFSFLYNLFLLGFGGFLSIVAYSVYNYRKRDRNVRTSVYVIHTRMAAQGFVIALLTGGVCYKMISKMTAAKKEIIPAIALPKN